MSIGLKAFGVTQENGLLRIFPVSSFRNTDNMFQCVDDDTGSFLNVAFVLGKLCMVIIACVCVCVWVGVCAIVYTLRRSFMVHN